MAWIPVGRSDFRKTYMTMAIRDYLSEPRARVTNVKINLRHKKFKGDAMVKDTGGHRGAYRRLGTCELDLIESIHRHSNWLKYENLSGILKSNDLKE